MGWRPGPTCGAAAPTRGRPLTSVCLLQQPQARTDVQQALGAVHRGIDFAGDVRGRQWASVFQNIEHVEPASREQDLTVKEGHSQAAAGLTDRL